MRVQGKILSAVNDVITIRVNADAQGWCLDHNARTVEVRVDDGRSITADQRRKIYATMRDIADWMGDMPDSVKAFFKWSFLGRVASRGRRTHRYTMLTVLAWDGTATRYATWECVWCRSRQTFTR